MKPNESVFCWAYRIIDEAEQDAPIWVKKQFERRAVRGKAGKH